MSNYKQRRARADAQFEAGYKKDMKRISESLKKLNARIAAQRAQAQKDPA